MFLDLIKLIKIENISDEVGNLIPTEISNNSIYAKRQNVSIKEYYSAVSVGLKPTIEFRIRKANYNKETEIEFNNNRFVVIRAIEKPPYDMVLVCSEKEGR